MHRSVLCTEVDIYFLLTYHNWYKVNSIISAFHKHNMTQSLFYISVIMYCDSVKEKKNFATVTRVSHKHNKQMIIMTQSVSL